MAEPHKKQTVGGLTFRVEPPAAGETASHQELVGRPDSNKSIKLQQQQQQGLEQRQKVGTLSFRVEQPTATTTTSASASLSEPGARSSSVELDDALATSSLSSSSLAEALSQPSETGAPRHILESRKVRLQPGFSQVAWMQKMGRFRRSRARQVTPQELRQHCSVDSLWLSYRGIVYDCTRYIPYHPGGVEEILRGAGKDCTDAFDEIHKWVNVEAMLRNCVIGRLAPSSRSLVSGRRSTECPPCLDLLRWSAVTLLEKEQLSPTCIRFRFGLASSTGSQRGADESALGGTSPTEDDDDDTEESQCRTGKASNKDSEVTASTGVSLADCGGYPGQHLDLRWEGVGASGPVVREYTPISPLDQKGHFDLAVRIYPRPSGRMGQYLASLPIGAKVGCRGMQGRLFVVPGTGQFATHADGPLSTQPRRLVFCLAGSGVTPGLAILHALVAFYEAEQTTSAGAQPSLPTTTTASAASTAPDLPTTNKTTDGVTVHVLCSARHWHDTLGRASLLEVATRARAVRSCSVLLQFFISSPAKKSDESGVEAAAAAASNVEIHCQRRVSQRDILDALGDCSSSSSSEAQYEPTLLAWCGPPSYHRMLRQVLDIAKRPGLTAFEF